MFIESVSFVQDAETKYWSDISVTLKQMRFTEIGVTQADKNVNRNVTKKNPLKEQGNTRGKSLLVTATETLRGSTLFSR
jgi:hypothetical protein